MPRRASPRGPRLHPLGDAAALVELGRRVDTALNTRAIGLAAALRKRRGVREAVPGYASVTLQYGPEPVTLSQMQDTVPNTVRSTQGAPSTVPRHYTHVN